jgi:hypothetical protein
MPEVGRERSHSISLLELHAAAQQQHSSSSGAGCTSVALLAARQQKHRLISNGACCNGVHAESAEADAQQQATLFTL